ncbi:MAG: DNA repair protein RecO [Clostridia bacterium]|nr:DNA repair protein RecO [Clostridia bacterium]
MAEKIQAIVIKSNDRKEKDKSILLFSLEKGKVWATLRGVKSAGAKMKLAKSPFCFGEFILEEGKAGYVVTSFEAKETFHEISEDVDKYFEATSILEMVYAYDFSNLEEVQAIFVLVLKSLMRICFAKCQTLYVLNKFFLEVFKLSGFPLYSEICTCCKSKSFLKHYINFPNGEIVCNNCKNFDSQELSGACFSALKILSETSFEKLDTIKLAQNSEFELLKILVKNFECHFDKKLKLLGILS